MRRELALAVLAVVACGAQGAPSSGQILLYVDTDAPMPGATDAPLGPLDPTPLFDRVRIEVLAPGAAMPCESCVNDFPLDADALRAGASVGIVPPVGVTGYRARVRLYRLAFASPLGEPNAGTTLDVVVSLPVVQATGAIELTAFLKTDDVGKSMGTPEAPLPGVPGAPGSSRVGTWPPAQRVPCAGAPAGDEVCVPGGAYWMGNPEAKNLGYNDEGTTPRLVVVSPFFLKKTETTVAEFRAARPSPASTWSGSNLGQSAQDWCTFTATPQACAGSVYPCEDDVLNCMTVSEARAYCQARGGDLPTEAQYEYAASGLQSLLHVWGKDEPACGDAVFSRAGDGIFAVDAATCPANGHGGPLRPGKGARDQLRLPTGTVVDLAGNLAEWALDEWNRQSEQCWSAPGVYQDPLCAQASKADGPLPTLRGGSWLDDAEALQAATRTHPFQQALPGDADVYIGFRCARPAK